MFVIFTFFCWGQTHCKVVHNPDVQHHFNSICSHDPADGFHQSSALEATWLVNAIMSVKLNRRIVYSKVSEHIHKWWWLRLFAVLKPNVGRKAASVLMTYFLCVILCYVCNPAGIHGGCGPTEDDKIHQPQVCICRAWQLISNFSLHGV